MANYLKFDFETTPRPGANPYCYYRSIPVACGPRGLPFDRNLLYRNDGEGGFTDVSVESGIAAPARNYALGVVTGDWNNDGRVDLYVACDRTPSLLYIEPGRRKVRGRGAVPRRGARCRRPGALRHGGRRRRLRRRRPRVDIFRTTFPTSAPRSTATAARRPSTRRRSPPASAGTRAMSVGAPGFSTWTMTAGKTCCSSRTRLPRSGRPGERHPLPAAVDPLPQPRRRALRGRGRNSGSRRYGSARRPRPGPSGTTDNDGRVEALIKQPERAARPGPIRRRGPRIPGLPEAREACSRTAARVARPRARHRRRGAV